MASSSTPSSTSSPNIHASGSRSGYGHSMPTHLDMELLDLLSAMPSAFPHSGHGPGSPSSASYPTGPVIAGKRRPLATLSALRRPPIDPIILAASLSSGPHVTRHHFHHSYGDKSGCGAGCTHGASSQMPASQRKALQAQQVAADQEARANKTRAATTSSIQRRSTSQNRSHSGKPRSQSITGSYANCDLDENSASVAESDNDEVPEVTPSERALYASRQAPRSVRLKLEEEQRKAREAAIAEANKKKEIEAESQRKEKEANLASAHSQEVQKASSIRASDEKPNGSRSEVPTASHARQSTAETQALLKQALSERQAIASAPTTPSLPPTPGSVNQNPLAQFNLFNEGAGQSHAAQVAPQLARLSSIVRPPPLHVRCYARTRIPTPHGEIFCHLYRNNHDNKEHLALVVDPAQNEPDMPVEDLVKPVGPRSLRSKTLDEKWSPEETEMERIVRGAYVGRLGPDCQVASQAPPKAGRRSRAAATSPEVNDDDDEWEAPLVRIHSECYTGETIGSQRCDCGEQLDEALRLILNSGTGVEPSAKHSSSSVKKPRLPRGVVVYLRQEGRGIGLLDKLMAYNLQDMGHDTVSANVLLGHLPDARRYAAAAAILEDLGVQNCRLLTNNPEKMEAMEGEGIGVTERVGMIPRAWLANMRSTKRRSKKSKKKSKTRSKQQASSDSLGLKKGRVAELASGSNNDLASSILSQDGNLNSLDEHELGARHQGSDVEYSQISDDDSDSETDSDSDVYEQHLLRSAGATLIGGAATRGPELEKYLRTKVERMGHLLDLPAEQVKAKAKNQGQEAEKAAAQESEGGDPLK
ncbi:unnamed protein product [Sympodiomycopsis kandeliae]